MKTLPGITLVPFFLLAGLVAPAVDVPLEWKALTPQQSALCPANGPSTALAAKPPSIIRREPKPVSQYPLYGRVQVGKQPPLLFRIDEAGGSGRGYDRLILDFNRNTDLTDDVEYKGTVSNKAPSPYHETSLFGPVENPAEWKVGPWPAPLCVKVSLRKRSWWGRLHRPVLIGDLEARPAWYLQTTIPLPLAPEDAPAGLPNSAERIGIFDYNCNLQIGEVPSLRQFGPHNRNIAFTARDLLFRDFDRNETFDFNALFTETQLFGPLLCVGTNILIMDLNPNLQVVRVQPYLGPAGEVKLYEKLESATLVWSRNRSWLPVSVGLDHGRATVPAGIYSLHFCVLRGVDATGQIVLARAYDYTTTNQFQVVQGRTTPLPCGPPIELRLETKRFPIEQQRRGAADICRVDINVRVVGAGGEIYSSFARGPDLTVKSPPPKFRVLSESRQPILTGQLEYG